MSEWMCGSLDGGFSENTEAIQFQKSQHSDCVSKDNKLFYIFWKIEISCTHIFLKY